MFQVVYTSFSMGVDIGSSSFVWHLWFLLRVSTNLPDSFKFPITLFSYCVVMMLMIELYWTYASYCVLIHIFLTRTGLHNTYKRTHACFHNWVLCYFILSCKSLFNFFLPSSHTNLILSVYCTISNYSSLYDFSLFFGQISNNS